MLNVVESQYKHYKMLCQGPIDKTLLFVNMAHNQNAPTPDGFGIRLREAIDRAGLNQRTLANKLHLSEAAVSKWVNQSNEPDLATLSRLAAILSVSLDWLLGVRQAEEPQPHRPSIELVKAVRRLIRTLDAAAAAAESVAALMPDDED